MNILKTWFNSRSKINQSNAPVTNNKKIVVETIGAEKIAAELTAEYKKQIEKQRKLLKRTDKLHNSERSELIKQIVELEQMIKETEARVQELIKYREAVEKNASPLYKEAYDLFTKGRLDEALAILDEDKMVAIGKSSADARIFKAQLSELKYDFKTAGENYRKAAEIFPSLVNNFHAACFYNKHNDFKTAKNYYTRCLPLTKNPNEKVTVLYDLGVLYRNMNDYPKAAEAFEEASMIYRKLAALNPQTYLPDVAVTLNNLGFLHHNMNNYPKAVEAYEGALKTYRHLASADPQAYGLDVVVTTLNNLGVLHGKHQNYPKAVEAFEEVLKIRRELAAADPKTCLPNVAVTLNNLGIMHSNMKNFPRATEVYEEALAKYRELAAVNPETYQPDLTMTLAHLAFYYRDHVPDKERSIRYAKEALSHRSSVEHIPDARQELDIAEKMLIHWDDKRFLRGMMKNQKKR